MAGSETVKLSRKQLNLLAWLDGRPVETPTYKDLPSAIARLKKAGLVERETSRPSPAGRRSLGEG